MPTVLLIPEFTHQMALVPLAWLVVLAWSGRGRGAEWWWIAAAFAVSWLADTAAHWVDPWFVSAIYPVSQAAIVGMVFTSRREASLFVGFIVGMGVGSVLTGGLAGPEVLLHTVAYLGVVVLVWSLPLGRLRLALLMAFGVGWLAWITYAIAPGWVTWGIFQAVRAVSLGLFCWASWKPQPMLRVVA